MTRILQHISWWSHDLGINVPIGQRDIPYYGVKVSFYMSCFETNNVYTFY